MLFPLRLIPFLHHDWQETAFPLPTTKGWSKTLITPTLCVAFTSPWLVHTTASLFWKIYLLRKATWAVLLQILQTRQGLLLAGTFHAITSSYLVYSLTVQRYKVQLQTKILYSLGLEQCTIQFNSYYYWTQVIFSKKWHWRLGFYRDLSWQLSLLIEEYLEGTILCLHSWKSNSCLQFENQSRTYLGRVRVYEMCNHEKVH